MDLEGLANRLLVGGTPEDELVSRLAMEIGTFKDISPYKAKELAKSVLDEVKSARRRSKDEAFKQILEVPKAGATMHDLGVGCRGGGDFFVHQLIADLAGSGSLMPPEQQDDAGAIEAGGKIIVAAVDGTHSRLSDFPFIAGFHVARAAIRDVMVKGAKPVALVDDLHLSDDGDVGKLFDFVAGIGTVAELSGVPLIAGSTLRTGGDMVIGERMVSGVGCIGVAERLLKRANVREGDAILMTEGAGGGTISTTAIYSGNHDVAKETLNVDFITAVNALFEKGLMGRIDCMVDVTNGGIRGDAHEICKTAKVGMELRGEKIDKLVNPRVLAMLKGEGIDHLGVSIDSLLMFCPQEDKGRVLEAIGSEGIPIEEVGRVVRGSRPYLDGRELSPKFRESAYTPVKRVVGEGAPPNEGMFREGAKKAADRAKKKIKKTVGYVKENRS